MLPILLIGALAVAGGAALGTAAYYLRKAKAITVPVTTNERRLAFRRAVVASGIGNDWLRFFEQTAKRESRFNPNAMNRTVKEAAAAARSVDRNRKTARRNSRTAPRISGGNAVGRWTSRPAFPHSVNRKW